MTTDPRWHPPTQDELDPEEAAALAELDPDLFTRADVSARLVARAQPNARRPRIRRVADTILLAGSAAAILVGAACFDDPGASQGPAAVCTAGRCTEAGGAP